MSTKAIKSFMENLDRDISTLVLDLVKEVSLSAQLIKFLSLIDANINNWLAYCAAKIGNIKYIKLHHPQLLDFIVQNYVIHEHSYNAVCNLIRAGCIEEFLRILSNGRSKSDVTNRVLDHLIYILAEIERSRKDSIDFDHRINNRLSESEWVNVFTAGANENMSLGNPLGTSKRQRIFFKPYTHFGPTKIAIGVTTTIFMGSDPSWAIFVAGKFGDEHFMTPKLFNLDDVAVHADIGSAHSIVCCRKYYYCIGDNTNNQLGCGPSVSRLSKLTRCELPLLGANDEIIRCATSSRHTVIITIKDLFVTGANFGQLGEYASRSFRSNFQPKGFFRMLRPGDLFLGNRKVDVALSDNMTVIYGGNRARIFYEYHEYSVSFCNVHYNQSCNIVHSCVCRLPSNSATFVLFFSSVDGGVYLWQRHYGAKSLEPIWSLPDREVIALAASYMRSNNFGKIACSRNGDFYISVDEFVYKGTVMCNSDGNFQVKAHRFKGLPGCVKSVFVSPDANNLAFITSSNSACTSKVERTVENYRQERIFALRFMFLQKNRDLVNSQLQCCPGMIRVESKSKQFFVHRFMISIRCKVLLTDRWFKSNFIDLRRVNDQTVSELIEFIYLGTSVTFRIAEKMATRHMLNILTNWECRSCGLRNPTIQFVPSGSFSHSVRDLQRGNSCESLSTNEIECSEQLRSEELVKNDDILDSIESGLTRMAELARDLRWKELQRCVELASNSFAEHSFDVVFATKFLDNDFTFENVFRDEDDLIVLECDDGSTFLFPKELLLVSPYFETLFRWHDDLITVQLEGISKRMLEIVMKFLISQELEEPLSFDEIIELLYFADHYCFVDLGWHAVYLLESEFHMDNIEEVIELAKTLYLKRLDEAIGMFVFRHILLFFESSERIEILRKLTKASKRVVEEEIAIYYDDIDNLPDNSGSGATLEFQDLCALECSRIFGVNIDDNTISPEEFLKIMRKPADNIKPSIRNQVEIIHEEDHGNEKDVKDGSGDNSDEKINNQSSSITIDNSDDIEPSTSGCTGNNDYKVAEEIARDTDENQLRNTCWNLSTPVAAIPIAEQLKMATEGGFSVSPTTQKNWKKHRNINGKKSVRKLERLDTCENSSPKSISAWGDSSCSPSRFIPLEEIMRQETSAKCVESPEVLKPTQPTVKNSPTWNQSPLPAVQGKPAQQQVKSLRQIQAEEAAANIQKTQAEAFKPLHCVAMEERAIREFEQYYENIYASIETPAFFNVKRVENDNNLREIESENTSNTNGNRFERSQRSSASFTEYFSKDLGRMRIKE